MKKLRLELDELAVESFTTSRDAREGRGTVRGHFLALYSYQQICEGSWEFAVCDSADQCLTAGAECFTQYGADTCRPHFTCPECAYP